MASDCVMNVNRGWPVHEAIAKSVEEGFGKSITDQKLQELSSKHAVPSNISSLIPFPHSDSPGNEMEVESNLQQIYHLVVISLSAIIKLMDHLYPHSGGEKTVDLQVCYHTAYDIFHASSAIYAEINKLLVDGPKLSSGKLFEEYKSEQVCSQDDLAGEDLSNHSHTVILDAKNHITSYCGNTAEESVPSDVENIFSVSPLQQNSTTQDENPDLKNEYSQPVSPPAHHPENGSDERIYLTSASLPIQDTVEDVVLASKFPATSLGNKASGKIRVSEIFEFTSVTSKQEQLWEKITVAGTDITQCFRCDWCNNTFSSLCYVQKHLLSHLQNEDKADHQRLEQSLNYLYNGRATDMHNNKSLQSYTSSENGRPVSKVRRFMCGYCGKEFAQKSTWRNHERVHTGKKPYECKLCGQKFAQLGSLNCHQAVHTKERPHECPVCRKTFTRKYYLICHMRLHSKENLYRCEVCERSFIFSKDLMTHRRTHSKYGKMILRPGFPNNLICDLCGKAFAQRSSLRAHQRIHTGEKPYACDICGRRFTQNVSVRQHRRMHTNEKPFQCKICDRQFARNYYLTCHLRLHNKDERYKCHICEKYFSSRQEIERHTRVHTGEKPYICEICGKGCSQPSDYNAHKQVHAKRIHKCDLCPKDFRTEDMLLMHRAIHTGDSPFPCSGCDKKFANKQALKRHSVIHSGEKPHLCHYCGKGFSQPASLNIHKRLHTGVKPYKCNLCGKSFTQSSQYKQHETTHSDERTFTCDKCPKTYKRKQHLAQHQKTHGDRKPFECSICGKDFWFESGLRKHKNKSCKEQLHIPVIKTEGSHHTGFFLQ